MKNFPLILMAFLILNACNHANQPQQQAKSTTKSMYNQVSTDDYVLAQPTENTTAVLVLFGGYPETAEDIQREFTILEKAKTHDIAIVYSNYNRKLWFEENELQELAAHIQSIFTENQLPTDHVYLGGFSSGGVVSLHLGNYLTVNQEIGLKPEGIFMVDSPIDLSQLYFSSEKNLERKFSEVSVQESTWLINELGNRFGNPHEDISIYEQHAVFTLKTGNIENISHLNNTKIRLYTEPDSLWWKEHRMADFEQTNAYLIQELSELLDNAGFTQVEYIPTENKGYRANGERHPHSWAIVDQDELINWMLDN